MQNKDCCLEKEVLDHSQEELYKALGLSDDEKETIDEIIDKILGEKTKLSELIESIWIDYCQQLSLPGRVYATMRIATEVYAMYLETIAMKLEEMEKERGGNNG